MITILPAEDSNPNFENNIIRISNVELFHVGQAFRLNRYPLNFQSNGNMPSSFVKKCAIHQSFNRAIYIDNSNGLTIESNLIYDIMGNAFYLNGGTPLNNIFNKNLAIFVHSSSSLYNEDITPGNFINSLILL